MGVVLQLRLLCQLIFSNKTRRKTHLYLDFYVSLDIGQCSKNNCNYHVFCRLLETIVQLGKI